MSAINHLFMAGIGAVGVVAGGLGVHYAIPPKCKTPILSELKFDGNLNEVQIEVSKYLWGKNLKVKLVNYHNYSKWVNKAKEYSVSKEKWPGDSIFIEDKSNENIGKLLRNKCYEASRWLNQGDTLNDQNDHLKNLFKNVNDDFKIENMKLLCTDGTYDTENSKINTIARKTLKNTFSNYTCDDTKEIKESWMKKMYDLKKEEMNNQKCQILEGSVISEISYKDGKKKYELWGSKKSGNNFISVPSEEWNIYSGEKEIPGFTDLFKEH